jgi:hypothetical protein
MHHRTLLTLLAAVLTVSSLALAQPAAETVDLRPMWQDGQTARYDATTTRRTTTELSAGGQNRTNETKVEMTATVAWRVTKASKEGGGVGEMTVEAMRFAMTGPDGQTLSMDDRGKGDDRLKPLAALLKAMRGTPVTIHVSPTGQITKTSGWKAIRTNGGQAAEKLEERDFIEMATDLAWLVGGAADLKPGATWTEKFNWSHDAGDLLHDSRYRFEGVEEIAGVPVAMVTRSAKLKLVPKQRDGGPPMTVRMTRGEQNSQMMFDLTRHEVVGQNVDRTLGVHIDITLGNRKLTTRVTEQVNSQLLRVEEK